MIIKKLYDKKLINPPSFVLDNTHMLVRGGSVSYAISNDTSDEDLIGVCIPSKRILFPTSHSGVILGFGHQGEKFDQYQKHHIEDKDEDKVYDLNVYNIVKYFELLRQGNPNLIETLFVHRKNVLFITPIGELMREHRHKFLSKEMFVKLRAYSFSQLSKIEGKTAIGKRADLVSKFGYDTKYGSHAVRLLLEAEQILLEGDLDLERNSQMLIGIRRGDWKLSDLKDFLTKKEIELEKILPSAKLPTKSNEGEIRQVLMKCLEAHYGSLEKEVVNESERNYLDALKKVKEVLNLVGI